MLTRLRHSLRRLLGHDRGTSAVEYALIAAGVAAMIVVSVTSLGSVVQAAYKSYCDNYSSASGITASCGASPEATPAPSAPSPGDDDDD